MMVKGVVRGMALRHEVLVDIEELGDAELSTRAADGDARAFAVLYRRHAEAAWRMAQAVTANPDDSADAVSEAFTNLLAALATRRLDPGIPFRPYLLVATRNAAIDQHRRRARVEPGGDLPGLEHAATEMTPAERVDSEANSTLLCDAFRSLPERWRSVLWMTEVEGIPAREVGARMGLTPNSAAQLARRAREGLRDRYLQAHVGRSSNPGCKDIAAQLGAYTAGSLSARAGARVEQHLAGCVECRARADELTDIGRGLRAIPLPLPLFLNLTTFDAVRKRFPVNAAHNALQFGERVTRSLAVGTAVLLALGLTTAGLMSGGQGVTPVPGSTSGGSVAIAPATSVSQLPETTSGNVTGSTPGRVLLSAPPSAPIVDVTKAAAPPARSPAPPPTTSNSPTPTSTPPQSPTPTPPKSTAGLGLTLGANLGIANAAASANLTGGCTGVSINRSPSCAPPAPASPGLVLSLTTPLGTISAGPNVPALVQLTLK